MVAACDADVLGKHLKFNKIDFFVNPRFYQKDKTNKAGLLVILKRAASCNLVGKDAVAAGVDSGLVEGKNVIKIGKVPHAQAVVIIL